MTLNYQDLLTADGSSEKIKTAIDNVFGDTSVGFIRSAITDTIHGINHRQQPNSVQINRDYYGLTFFTRPRMNMRTANLRQIREFSSLLTSVDLSLPRAIRAILDTECVNHGHTSGLVDNLQAFIPILTNQLISMSGWPDIDLPTFTSKPGAYQEAFSMADGITRDYATHNITANFRNIVGDPITSLFLVWCHYASQVFQGNLIPYPDALIENEIDYQTRIYRLVLDPSRRFIQKIAACGAAFPLNVPIGNSFNFESDTPINRANDQITINFRIMGPMYNDPILIHEFNQTVIQQNSSMADGFRASRFVQLNGSTFGLFNHHGYPRIDPTTWELEWWVPKDEYTAMVGEDSAEVAERYDENNIR
jgi:hypothetical protein